MREKRERRGGEGRERCGSRRHIRETGGQKEEERG